MQAVGVESSLARGRKALVAHLSRLVVTVDGARVPLGVPTQGWTRVHEAAAADFAAGRNVRCATDGRVAAALGPLGLIVFGCVVLVVAWRVRHGVERAKPKHE